jgi:hypothetical protein
LFPLQVRCVLLRNHLDDRRLQHLVATSVIGMVMSVDQQIDLAAAGHGLETLEEHLRRVSELAVDDDDCVWGNEPPHRAATRGERTHIASQRREHGDSRRLWRGGGRLLSEQPSGHQRASGNGQRRSQDEFTSIRIHVRSSTLWHV